jgi:hypothetical protein
MTGQWVVRSAATANSFAVLVARRQYLLWWPILLEQQLRGWAQK